MAGRCEEVSTCPRSRRKSKLEIEETKRTECGEGSNSRLCSTFCFCTELDRASMGKMARKRVTQPRVAGQTQRDITARSYSGFKHHFLIFEHLGLLSQYSYSLGVCL